MPGQLATRADAPVRRLKNVDLPVLGGPTAAALRMCARAPSAVLGTVRTSGWASKCERRREGSPAHRRGESSAPSALCASAEDRRTVHVAAPRRAFLQ